MVNVWDADHPFCLFDMQEKMAAAIFSGIVYDLCVSLRCMLFAFHPVFAISPLIHPSPLLFVPFVVFSPYSEPSIRIALECDTSQNMCPRVHLNVYNCHFVARVMAFGSGCSTYCCFLIPLLSR